MSTYPLCNTQCLKQNVAVSPKDDSTSAHKTQAYIASKVDRLSSQQPHMGPCPNPSRPVLPRHRHSHSNTSYPYLTQCNFSYIIPIKFRAITEFNGLVLWGWGLRTDRVLIALSQPCMHCQPLLIIIIIIIISLTTIQTPCFHDT